MNKKKSKHHLQNSSSQNFNSITDNFDTINEINDQKLWHIWLGKTVKAILIITITVAIISSIIFYSLLNANNPISNLLKTTNLEDQLKKQEIIIQNQQNKNDLTYEQMKEKIQNIDEIQKFKIIENVKAEHIDWSEIIKQIDYLSMEINQEYADQSIIITDIIMEKSDDIIEINGLIKGDIEISLVILEKLTEFINKNLRFKNALTTSFSEQTNNSVEQVKFAIKFNYIHNK